VVERPVDRATIRTFPLLLYVSQSVSFVAGSPRAHHAWVTCGVDSIVYDRWRHEKWRISTRRTSDEWPFFLLR
jgi:hypothetical protein